MSLVSEWHQLCFELATLPKLCTAGTRKILRGRTWSVPCLDDTLGLTELGYSAERGHKLSQLTHHYLNEDSIERAVKGYKERVVGGSYGSVGISTHGNHKGGFTKQGFCIQCFTLTHVPGKERYTEVDIFYRTTEVVKKFGADLVFFRDIVLPHFDRPLVLAPIRRVNFHFANVSVHPMFFPILLMSMSTKRWKKEMLKVKEQDPAFFYTILRWTRRCIVERETSSFKQAGRVGLAVYGSLGKTKSGKLVDFCNTILENKP